ncbi:MAG: polyhydroxyalkanoic acid system family protein [Burkholderiaceae bacterium]
MSDIHIVRPHHFGLADARRTAYTWAERVEREFELDCTWAEGATHDEVRFKRGGVEGTLMVRQDRFELEATLGLIAAMFKDQIEAEIVRELDAVLSEPPGELSDPPDQA